MGGPLGRIAETWTWFWSAEHLDAPPPPARQDADLASPRSATLRSVFFACDELPPAPEGIRPNPSFLGWLLAPETLAPPTPDRPEPADTED